MNTLLALLAVLFIGFKILNVITWPWVWVLAPVWGPFAFIAFMFGIMVIGIALGGLVNVKSRR